ncbi:unnamed protein product [Larinioides sclopetarius]|uniref:Uncharacterized protein n=1 Tax=Larinioides sclopetarius TaxID=280406 RepID=A0AAV2BVM3_9ARAC
MFTYRTNMAETLEQETSSEIQEMMAELPDSEEEKSSPVAETVDEEASSEIQAISVESLEIEQDELEIDPRNCQVINWYLQNITEIREKKKRSFLPRKADGFFFRFPNAYSGRQRRNQDLPPAGPNLARGRQPRCGKKCEKPHHTDKNKRAGK